MTTEELIVYNLIETVRGFQRNQDTQINPLVVRDYLNSYRPKIIMDASSGGMDIDDICYQPLGELEFVKSGLLQFKRKMPKILSADGMGIMLDKFGWKIPVMKSGEYETGIRSRFNQFHPKACFMYDTLMIYVGKKQENTNAGFESNPDHTEHNQFIEAFFEDNNYNNNSITIDVRAVLDNPADMPGYNWKKSIYPLSGELIEKLKNLVLYREFNIVLGVSSKDTIGDGKDEAQGQVRQPRDNNQ